MLEPLEEEDDAAAAAAALRHSLCNSDVLGCQSGDVCRHTYMHIPPPINQKPHMHRLLELGSERGDALGQQIEVQHGSPAQIRLQ